MSLNFFKIIHWKKLLYIVLVQFLFKICFLHDQGFETRLSFWLFGLLSLATVFTLASGYLTSYSVRKYHQKHLKYTVKRAIGAAVLSVLAALALCTFVSLQIQEPLYVLIGIVAVILVNVYSIYVTKKTFFSNIINAFVKTISVLTVWWFDTPVGLNEEQWDVYFKLQLIAMFYVSVSFLGNIVRETVRDIVNINHDYTYAHKTIPIVLGRKRAKNIALIIAFIASLIVFAFAIVFIKNKFILTTILLLGTFPEMYFIYHLLNARTQREFQFLLKISAVLYALALLSVPVVAYYFRYVI